MLDIRKKEKKVKEYRALKRTGSCNLSHIRRIFCKSSMVLIFLVFRDKGAFILSALINYGSRSSLNGVVSKQYIIKEALMAAK